MAVHNEMGQIGEEMARRYLVQNGYEIVETNWRLGRHEMDIIAYYKKTLVFVEVKTRRGDSFGAPESFVDRKKQRACIALANAYILKNKRKEEARFDIISVVLNSSGATVEHIPNAFSAVGQY